MSQRFHHNNPSAFVPIVSPSRSPFSPPFTASSSSSTFYSTCKCSKAHSRVGNKTVATPRRRRPTSQILQHAHTMSEIVGQFMLSCSIGLAGIVGNKATEKARLIISGDRRADSMEKLALEIDSFRRRKELSTAGSSSVEKERDWSDVGVDKLSNIVVIPEDVPVLGANDELLKFDSLLGLEQQQLQKLQQEQRDGLESNRANNFITDENKNKNTNSNISEHVSQRRIQLPTASEFELDEEEFE